MDEIYLGGARHTWFGDPVNKTLCGEYTERPYSIADILNADPSVNILQCRSCGLALAKLYEMIVETE